MRPEILDEVRRRDPLLFAVGVFNLALLLAMVLAFFFDHRLVTGLSPWIKPAKFATSITLYAWTVAWFLFYLPGPRWATATVRWSVAVAMVTEILCIAGQAARGTTSHYNVATPFDFAVFQTMAVMILVNTLAAVLLLVLFFRPLPLARGYLWGIRLGLIIFILGSLEGVTMILRNAHTVGLPDGGPGLPLINWSTRGGDLRVAHFLALHSLQLLALVGYGVGRWRPQAPRLQVLAVAAAAVLCLGLIGLTLGQALAGRPLLLL